MAFIVGITIIVTQELERVVCSNMLRMILDKLLDAVPKSWYRLNILVQADDEAVLLAVVLHELEWIIVYIAEQFNTWLNSPVPLVVHHERLAEEEARLKSAHVSV